jgi:hypothetical protein
LLVVFLAFLSACNVSSKQAVIPASPEPQRDATKVEEQLKSLGYVDGSRVTKTVNQNSFMERKIIRNGQLQIVVKYYEPFFKSLQNNIVARGGYISQIQVTRGATQISSAMIVLRLRPEELDPTISWLKEEGIVTSEKVTADDISEQYYDLKTRLSNARRFEERLLEMLKAQTGKLQDVLLVEDKLNQIREQIEQFEGKLRYFDNLASLATLTLNISVQEKYIAPRAPGFGERAGRVWHDSTASLKEFTQDFGLLVVALVPWLLPMAIALLVLRSLLKLLLRTFRKRRIPKSAKTSPLTTSPQ